MSDKIPVELQKQIDDFAARLMEQCDSVRIFVTCHDGGKELSQAYDTGAGNLYAQLGQVREWIVFQDAYCAEYAARKQRDTTNKDRGEEPPQQET